MNNFYIYIHIKLNNGKPFYVGKGKSNRAYSIKGRNNHWRRIVEKYGYDIIIIEDNLSEKEAFELEIFWINRIGIDNLSNMTIGGNGGDTISNHPKRCEITQKISKANLGSLNSNWEGKSCTPSWMEKQIKSQSKKPIIVTDCDTDEKWEFINSKEAAKFLNVSHSNIRTNKITGHKIKKRYIIQDKN